MENEDYDREYDFNRKTDFSRDELLEILNAFLEHKPVFDEKFAGVDMSTIKNPEINYPIDNVTHEYIGYDYTYVRAAYRVSGVVSDYGLLDLDYLYNYEKMCEKYQKHEGVDLSEEKLDFLEIITILTLIERANRHADGCVYEYAVEDGTFYNLLCRLEEIKNEL